MTTVKSEGKSAHGKRVAAVQKRGARGRFLPGKLDLSEPVAVVAEPVAVVAELPPHRESLLARLPWQADE